MTATSASPARVLVAKPGLDGPTFRGGQIVACATPVRGDLPVSGSGSGHRVHRAAGEDVAVVGLSILCRAPVALTQRYRGRASKAADAGDIAVVVGGTIPQNATCRRCSTPVPSRCSPTEPLDVLVSGSARSPTEPPCETGRDPGPTAGTCAQDLEVPGRHRMGGLGQPGHLPGCRRCPTTSTMLTMGVPDGRAQRGSNWAPRWFPRQHPSASLHFPLRAGPAALGVGPSTVGSVRDQACLQAGRLRGTSWCSTTRHRQVQGRDVRRLTFTVHITDLGFASPGCQSLVHRTGPDVQIA